MIVHGWIGDSWTGGSADVARGWTVDAVCDRSMRAGSIRSCQGGTGYVADGKANSNTYSTFGDPARIAAVAAGRPGLMIIFGSVNDLWKDGVQAAALACYRGVREAMPDVPVAVVGPQPTSAETMGQDRYARLAVQVRDAVDQAGGADGGFVYVDPTGLSHGSPVPWRDGASWGPGRTILYRGCVWRVPPLPGCPWEPGPGVTPEAGGLERLTWCLTGMGKKGSEKQDGSRDQWLSADGVHPTMEGSVAYGLRLAEGIAGACATLASHGWTVGHTV